MRNFWCPIERGAQIIGDRWSLLILREMSLGPQRFKTLKKNIAGISMDQLSRKLEHLCAAEMIVRQEFAEAPPRVEYQLTDKGLSFLPVLKKLLVWILQNTWGAPAPGELTDVALSIRVMVSFLGQGEGLVLLRLTDSPGAFTSYLIQRSADGRVRVQQVTDVQRVTEWQLDATVGLSMKDWLKLLGAEPGQVVAVNPRFEGNVMLLKRILPVFSRPGVHESPDGDGHHDAVGRKNPVRASL